MKEIESEMDSERGISKRKGKKIYETQREGEQ